MEIIRQGEISSIDVENGKARVIFIDRDNKVSDWLSLLVPFSESHSDNYNLTEGQSVLVLSIPDMPEQGYILGCPMRKSNISAGEVKRTFSDGGFYSYYNGTLTLNPINNVVINANEVEINSEKVKIIAKKTEINSDVGIKGKVIIENTLEVNSMITKNDIPYTHP